jgi:hypothetical protein
VLQFPNYLNIHIEKGTSNETWYRWNFSYSRTNSCSL